MKRQRIAFLSLLGGAGFLLALLGALILLAPRLVNTKAFKEGVLSRLERATGVRLSYDLAEVSFFPRPRVAIRGVALELPGIAQGTIRTLEADPQLLPLLRGEIRIGSAALSSPDFRVRLPAKEKPEKPPSLEDVEKSVSSLLAGMRGRAPGMAVTVRDGLLELSGAGGPIVSLRDLSARVTLPPDRLTVHIRCASQYWDDLSIETSVRPEGLRSETRFETSGFLLNDFTERIAPGAAPWLGQTIFSLRGKVDAEGLRKVTAGIEGAVPILTIRRDSRSRVVRVRTVRGTLDLRERTVRAVLSDLALDDPGVRLAGEFSANRDVPRIEASLTGKDLEIPPVREALLALAGDVPTVRAILGVVRGGIIRRFSFQTGGRSPGELGDLDALRFHATLSGGSLRIPGPDLPLEDVGAEVSMEKGTLAGEGIAARLRDARASGGALRIGFAEKDPPFHAEFQADAEIGEVHSLLRRLVPGKEFREELGMIRDLRGDVSGRVALTGSLSSIGVRVDATKVRCTAKYDRIPFPVAVDGGQIAYDGGSLAVKELQGSVGASTYSGVTGKVTLSDPWALSIRSGNGHLVLGELFPWLSSFGAVREATRDVRSLRGDVDIGSLSLEGAVRAGREWTYDASGSVADLSVDTPLLGGALSVPAARFRVRPESVSFSDVRASLLDAAGRGSLELGGYRRGADRIAASFEGDIGPDAAKWLYERVGLPEPARVKAPFTVAGAEFRREPGGAVRAKAALAFHGGISLSFASVVTPGKTTIDPLVLRGPGSDATLALRIGPDTAGVKFSGTISRNTVERILPLESLPGNEVRGTLEAELDRARPARSTVRGTLEAKEAKVPWKPLEPLDIHDLSLEADGRNVRILSSNLAWDNVPVTLTGTAGFGDEEVVADLDVSAGDFEMGWLLHSVAEAARKATGGADRGTARPEETGRERPGATPARFPLRGVVRFRADSVSLRESFFWKPLRAIVRLEGSTIRATVTEANLCGFSTLGSVTLGEGEPSFTMSVSAAGENIQEAIRCLTEKRVEFSGRFSLSSRLAGEGKGDALLRSLAGPVEMDVKDGRIRQMATLAKVFAFLNVTETFRGVFPDFREKGFAYRNLSVRGELMDGKFTLKEAVLDAPSMEVFATGEVNLLTREADLKVLVAPFRTVDAVVRKIPVLGYILGGTLISVPVRITGDIRDPKVTTMEAAHVGSSLLGIAERTLKTPVHLFSPILPGKEKKAAEGATP